MALWSQPPTPIESESYRGAVSYDLDYPCSLITIDVDGAGPVYMDTKPGPRHPFPGVPYAEARLAPGHHSRTFDPPVYGVRFRLADATLPASVEWVAE